MQETPRPIRHGQPYQTQDTPLAVTLLTCGVPPWRECGIASGVFSVYTRDTLLTYRDGAGRQIYKGWEPEVAARDAWKNGRPGIVVYRFIQTELLTKVLTAYSKHEKRLAKMADAGDDTPNPDGGGAVEELDIEPEIAARFACQLLKNRKVLLGEWKRHVPWLALEGASRMERDGEKLITIGSMKAYPLDATPETRKRLGV